MGHSGDRADIKAGRPGKQAIATVQGENDGAGDQVTWPGLGSVLKVKPMGLNGLKGNRIEERGEWRMPITFSDKLEEPKGWTCCLLSRESLCGKHF